MRYQIFFVRSWHKNVDLLACSPESVFIHMFSHTSHVSCKQFKRDLSSEIDTSKNKWSAEITSYKSFKWKMSRRFEIPFACESREFCIKFATSCVLSKLLFLTFRNTPSPINQVWIDLFLNWIVTSFRYSPYNPNWKISIFLQGKQLKTWFFTASIRFLILMIREKMDSPSPHPYKEN